MVGALRKFSELPAAMVENQTYDSLHFESIEHIIAAETVNSGKLRPTPAEINKELHTGKGSFSKSSLNRTRYYPKFRANNHSWYGKGANSEDWGVATPEILVWGSGV